MDDVQLAHTLLSAANASIEGHGALSDNARGRALELIAKTWQADHRAMRRAGRIAADAERLGRAVIFVVAHHGNFPTVEYVARALREKGINVFGVYLFSEAPDGVYSDLREAHGEGASRAMSCGGSLAPLAKLLHTLPRGTPIYLQAHARWAFLSMLIKGLRSDLRVVQEIYDWMGSFVEPGKEDVFVDEGVFTLAEIELMRDAEKFVRTRLDGFVYKDGGWPMDRMRAESCVPSVQIVPAPNARLTPPPEHGDKKLPGLRVVHAGQIRGGKRSRVFGDIQCLRVFQALTEQKIHVHVYPSFYKDDAHREQLFGDFIGEAERDREFFHFERRRPIANLMVEMSRYYHYGSLLYHFDDDLVVGKAHLAGAMASKLFTYLAAGLPVIVSEELEYMASVVRDRDVGLVVKRTEIPHLKQKLDENYERLRLNVQRAFEDHWFENRCDKLLSLICPQHFEGTHDADHLASP